MHMNSLMQIPALRGSYLTISLDIIKGSSLTQAISGFVCIRQRTWKQDILKVVDGFSLYNLYYGGFSYVRIFCVYSCLCVNASVYLLINVLEIKMIQ